MGNSNASTTVCVLAVVLWNLSTGIIFSQEIQPRKNYFYNGSKIEYALSKVEKKLLSLMQGMSTYGEKFKVK